MTERRFVPVDTEEGHACHAGEATGNYATLCGISTDDDEENGREVPLMIGERIDCDACIAIIRTAKLYRERDFAAHKRKGSK